jgi:hypothetical protein
MAGMFDELGLGEVIDRATQQNPEMRIVMTGNAVTAMVHNGLGFVNQQLFLVPMFFQRKPTQRLIAPGIKANTSTIILSISSRLRTHIAANTWVESVRRCPCVLYPTPMGRAPAGWMSRYHAWQ